MNYFLAVKFYGWLVLRFNGITNNGKVEETMQALGDKLTFPTWWIYALIAAGICSYLFGSINTALIVSRVKYHDDIRKYGSKNAGMTNMIRVYGKSAGILTIIGDFLKTVIPVATTMFLLGETAAYLAGLCCVIGHAYPIFFNFKGGKGVLATAAMVLAIEPVLFLILFAVFAIIFLFTKYVSLGSIFSALMLPVFMPQIHKLMYRELGSELLSFATVICLVLAFFVLYLHKANIRRLLDREENKFELKKRDKKDKRSKKATEKVAPSASDDEAQSGDDE